MPALMLNLKLDADRFTVVAMIVSREVWLKYYDLPDEIQSRVACRRLSYLGSDVRFSLACDVLAIASPDWRREINSEMARLKAQVDKL
jgi:hypothetical protein